MKKRRLCARNYSPTQRYSHTHERLVTRTKSNYDSKGRSSRRSYKLQQNDGQFDNVSCLKTDAFGSLESLFDIKKSLNLRNVYPLASDYYCKNKLIKKKSVETLVSTIKSEPLVETLFLQSPSSRNLESHIFKSVNARNEVTVSKELQTRVSNSAQKLQQNYLIHDQQNHLINMAENGDELSEAPEEQQEAMEVEGIVVEGAIMENGVEGVEEAEEVIVPDRDEADVIAEVSIDKYEEVEDILDLSEEPPPFPIVSNIAEELKAMNEKVIILADEIQQLKREVTELSEKPELTEEDTLVIKERQDVLMSKVAELEALTQQFQYIALKDVKYILEESLYDTLVTQKEDEVVEKEIDKERMKAFEILEKDRFDLPQVEYPEDKLPRVIVCGQTEDQLPKIVVADSERKGREKCFEKLTGKLTESLTMQEKLVQENAQLEGGKYKLEEALLEKDAAIEGLERKVCGLQAEMRMVVKENTELSRQLTTLNQLVTSSTCRCTSPGIIRSSSTSPPLSPQPRNDISCQCKCCLSQSQLADVLTPETICDSSRLTGGGSRTEGCCLEDSNIPQNIEMCSRGPAVVKAPFPRGVCPAELEDKLTVYGNSTKQLEQQLGNMENEVRNMQIELANVQRERQQLEQQRKLLKCTGPCAPCACGPSPPSTCVTSTQGLPSTPKGVSVAPAVSSAKVTMQIAPPICTGPCTTAPMGTSTCTQQQLRDLHEQYARLQEDYKNKLCEVSYMRTDAEKMKQELRDAKEDKEQMEIKLIDAQERLKLLEAEKGKIDGHQEQIIEQEQALMVAKQRVREAQDELEENRSLIQDLSAQLEDYRNRYLQAQQQVEEQRRQLDLMEMDNARMNENVTLEIGRVKSQFQEKLAELAPLPEILKQSQTKLQEVQQKRLVAERNCEGLSRELLGCKDKMQNLQSELETLRTEYQALQDERGQGSGLFEEMEKKCSEFRHENERMKNSLARFEEHKAQLQKRIDEKMHESTQLSAMLEQVREDSARQVARTKERCETVRWSMQRQVAEMEKQLAQCRATARAAQRDRDEIRQKMQSQINNLNEAFEHAQGRIRSLQGHVNYLKTSYSNIFIGQGEAPTSILSGDGPGTGHDSCDCNY